MNKQEKLKHLDDLLLDKMIKIMETDTTEELADLATLSNYLAKNNQVAEKPKSSVEDDIKKRVKEAEARRNSK